MALCRFVRCAALAVTLVGTAASAQVAGELILGLNDNNTWSANAGRTNGAGNGVILGEVGWPGISVQYSKGFNDYSDLGFRASFLYSFEGTTNSLVGLNLAVPYRRQLFQATRLGVTAHIDPGATFYGNRGVQTGNVWGVGAPVGITAGYRWDDHLTLDVTGDIESLVSFSNPVGIFFGPMLGVGGEYKLDANLALTLRARAGPEFGVVSGGSGAQFAFLTLIGLAYNTH